MNFNIFKKELDSIKMARKSGKSLRSLQPIVKNLYKKINMSGGTKKKPEQYHLRKNKTYVSHLIPLSNEYGEYEHLKRTDELVKMYNNVVNTFKGIDETENYILTIAGDNKNKDLLRTPLLKDVLNKISNAYLEESGELFNFNRINFIKTTTPKKPKSFKWDLEHRYEKLIPFSIAYGATKILQKNVNFDSHKAKCLEMLLNSLAPEVNELNQSYRVTSINGSIKINRKETKSLYEKEITDSGKFTFKLFNNQSKKINTLVIEDPIIKATARSKPKNNSKSWADIVEEEEAEKKEKEKKRKKK
jgi:hypothetical protein